ncbi:hypothetical protein PAL_GLEAN10018952 [Pteropus alecto]|uniref:Uncharacterized protein n=1 Tax=Pteropus alecto TaxID=9402 RepID=L5L127_PTEAL|nr:hypothetical protein PAL_GLEAN10018952 [Pteropus alecto]
MCETTTPVWAASSQSASSTFSETSKEDENRNQTKTEMLEKTDTNTQKQNHEAREEANREVDRRLNYAITQPMERDEEVAVEDGLDNTGHNGDEVEEALEVEAPDPVDEIERAVEAQEEQVVSGDGLRLPGLADHEELREDGHRLKVDGEGPQNLEEKHTLRQHPVPTTGPPETRLSSVGQRRERESAHQSLEQ